MLLCDDCDVYTQCVLLVPPTRPDYEQPSPFIARLKHASARLSEMHHGACRTDHHHTPACFLRWGSPCGTSSETAQTSASMRFGERSESGVHDVISLSSAANSLPTSRSRVTWWTRPCS